VNDNIEGKGVGDEEHGGTSFFGEGYSLTMAKAIESNKVLGGELS